MWKRLIVGILVIGCLFGLGVGFGRLTALRIIDDSELAAAVPGEEDVVIRSGDPNQAKLTLTCNVDWGEEWIPKILAICKQKQVHVTFFVSGKWAANHPTMLRQMYIAGHEIQSHGYHHKLCTGISKEETKREIQKTEEAILNLIGTKPTVFAPPSGDYDSKTVDLCRELGYRLSLWSSDTIDWKDGSTASVIQYRVLRKPLPGAIVLMHPKEETVKALPDLIDAIKNQGITIVPLQDLPLPQATSNMIQSSEQETIAPRAE